MKKDPRGAMVWCGASELKHYPEILLQPNGEIQFCARAHLRGSVIYYLKLTLHTNQAGTG